MKKTRAADTYLTFLALTQAAMERQQLPPLEPSEERILRTVALANAREERLCVRDLMAFRDLGAPATIHGRLKSMREREWLVLSDTDDARRKQVEIGPVGKSYLRMMARLISRAVPAT